MTVPASSGPEAELQFHEDIIYPGAIPFAIVHLVCLAAIWTGVTPLSLIICVALYFGRMFGVSAGYHRYFSHRSYKTSRVGQFLLAFLAQSSAQRGVLWWAARHRHHHRHSDTELDVHSPRHRGFFYAHVGWIFTPQNDKAAVDAVPDLSKYPEILWLNNHPYIPATVLAVATWLIAGWPGLIVGFFWSTVLLYHGTFMINSLAHVHGNKRYVTGDDSRNNWWLAILTLGEGWHNNHHAYMASTRQGFRWWEVDISFYLLKIASWFGIVWDLNEPPEVIVRNEKPLSRGVLDSVAHQLAATFSADEIARKTRDAWAQSVHSAQSADATLAPVFELPNDQSGPHLPHLPSIEELRNRAQEMFAATPSVEDIARRAREIIEQAVRGVLKETAVGKHAGQLQGA